MVLVVINSLLRDVCDQLRHPNGSGWWIDTTVPALFGHVCVIQAHHVTDKSRLVTLVDLIDTNWDAMSQRAKGGRSSATSDSERAGLAVDAETTTVACRMRKTFWPRITLQACCIRYFLAGSTAWSEWHGNQVCVNRCDRGFAWVAPVCGWQPKFRRPMHKAWGEGDGISGSCRGLHPGLQARDDEMVQRNGR